MASRSIRTCSLLLTLLGFLLPSASCMPKYPPPGTIVPLKLDDPKTAALTFVRAIGAGDVSTVKAASLGTDRQKRWIEATASMVDGLLSFDRAMTARFGIAAGRTHMDLVNALNAVTYEPERALENATVIDGDDDTAQLQAISQDYAQRMVYASRVRKVDGVWKVDLPRIFAENPDLAALNDSPEVDRLTRVGNAMREVAAEVKAGQYQTVDDARAAADERTAE